MTDRIHSLTVVLDHDIRDDDVEAVVMAISMVKGVLSVGKEVSDSTSYMARERALSELRKQIQDVLWPPVRS